MHTSVRLLLRMLESLCRDEELSRLLQTLPLSASLTSTAKKHLCQQIEACCLIGGFVSLLIAVSALVP